MHAPSKAVHHRLAGGCGGVLLCSVAQCHGISRRHSNGAPAGGDGGGISSGQGSAQRGGVGGKGLSQRLAVGSGKAAAEGQGGGDAVGNGHTASGGNSGGLRWVGWSSVGR